MVEENKNNFAVMRWLNDGNRLSVHCLKQVVEPKLPVDQYKVGLCGLSLYPGYPGRWQFRILKVGRKIEMNKWLKSNIELLVADITDKFCEEKDDSPADEAKNNMQVSDHTSTKCSTPKKIRKHEDLTPADEAKCNTEVSDSASRSCSPPRKIRKSEVTPTKTKENIRDYTSPTRSSPRILAKVAGIDDGQYLNRIDLKKKDLYKEKLEKLEEDVKSLRRKNRKLEERVCQLERNKSVASSQTSLTPASPHTSLTPASPRTSQTPTSPQASQTVGQWTPTAKKECMPRNEQQQTEDVDKSLLDEETLIKSVKGVVGDQNVMKHLCLQIFTEEDMINSTQTGKRTAKAMDNVKPPLDQIKFNMLETVIMKVTSFDKATFYKKFENQQKMLRRAKKQ